MKTYLDWSSYSNSGLGDAYADIPKQGGNFAKAVSVCINSSHCESESAKGVMCPSYRVSNDPLLSTGGRVKLLKEALNSDDALLAMYREDLSKSLDLCLSCKGCKRECENEVDMAMIKIEYLAQRHSHHPVPLRTLIFSHLPALLNRIKPSSALIRLYNRWSILSSLANQLLGIAKRSLPQPQSSSILRDFENQHSETFYQNADGKSLVIFADTFTTNFEPLNITAAIDVLTSAGYRVHIAKDPQSRRPLCCGRTHLAHGLVDNAKKNARRVLSSLSRYVENNIAIIGLEPACLLAIRDDYRFLDLGKAAEKTAKQAILFEEFIARESQAGRFKLELKTIPAMKDKALIHGHCHQKAVGAMKSMRKVLKMIPELQFELIESSCCGMAGSFGLEAEHHQYSLDMAELSLLTAIRQQPESAIIANGFSCRHQISDNTNRKPLHIARLLQASCQQQPLPNH